MSRKKSLSLHSIDYLCVIMSILLNISGLTIDFDTRYPDYVLQRCANYVVTEGEPDLRLRSTDEDILLANRDNVGVEEAELYAMTIPLSEEMPALARIMTHGVAISCDGKGFIFTAESGVGKSTHAFLWQKYLGEDRVRVINGDKPILWFKDGDIFACGSPWSGKEHLDENVSVSLRGICLLHRLTETAEHHSINAHDTTRPCIYRATKEETLDFFLHQIFIPLDPVKQIKTLQMVEELYEKVPVYQLYTDMSEEGVKTSTEELLK